MNSNAQSQHVSQHTQTDISSENTNNPSLSNTNTMMLTAQTLSPSLVHVVTVAPQVAAVTLPKTGSPTGVTMLFLSMLPFGIILKKLP